MGGGESIGGVIKRSQAGTEGTCGEDVGCRVVNVSERNRSDKGGSQI